MSCQLVSYHGISCRQELGLMRGSKYAVSSVINRLIMARKQNKHICQNVETKFLEGDGAGYVIGGVGYSS